MRHLAFLSLFSLLCFAAGCEPAAVTTPTQVTVRVTSTDAALLSSITVLNVRASLSLGQDKWRTPVKQSISTSGVNWPIDIPVFPRNDKEATAEFEVAVEAVQNNRVLAEARAVTSFLRNNRNAILELRLFSCSRPDPICSPNCVGTGCSVCGVSGECEPVLKIDPGSLPQMPIEEPKPDGGTGGDSGVTTGDSEGGIVTMMPNPAVDGGSTVPPVMTMQPGTDGGATNSMVDAGPSGPAAECSASMPCSAGFMCSNDKCVSLCTTTQCDTNATCSLASGAPICTCNTGFVPTSGSGTAVVCTRDVACDQLGCSPNAGCVVENQLHKCVCNNGYTGNGTTCNPVSCSQPTIANGTVSATGGITLGKTATYTCSRGYEQGGGSWTRTCGPDMQWSGTQPVCNQITCPGLSNPTNGSVSTTARVAFGGMATFSCGSGYKLKGSASLTCTETGWSGSSPTCSKACGDGEMDSGEACDYKNPNWSVWTCNTDCTTKTMYAACPATTCANGEACLLGFCTKMCSANTNNCVTTPSTSVTQRLCLTARNPTAYDVCAATGCRSGFDCAPGLGCFTSEGFSYCAQCSGATSGVCN